VYDIGFKLALENIKENGGLVEGDNITLPLQSPATVKLEQGFPDLIPVQRKELGNDNIKELNFEFEGTGFVLTGSAEKKEKNSGEYIFKVAMYVDGVLVETANLPTSFTTRRNELFWKYALPNKKHTVSIRVLNPDNRYRLRSWDYIIFSDKPAENKNN
jgi:hypothetical protein